MPTDASGRAQVKVKLPDNLTRYRVMAVSVAGGKLAGAGESAITARKQLMARPSAPRFLNFGDRAELPVVLQNQTDEAMSVNVAVRATNAELTEGAGRRVTVPANDRVEVRFPVAAVKPGTARFQIVSRFRQRERTPPKSRFPVYTPATTEAFATYGVIDEGSVAQPVKAPADAVKTLRRTGSHDRVDATSGTDRRCHLPRHYPYECSEQIASRVIAIAALKDVLTAFKAKDLPSPQALRDSVSADIKTPARSCKTTTAASTSGGAANAPCPYVSVHVAHALVRAREQGLRRAEEMLENVAQLPARNRREDSGRLQRRGEARDSGLRALRRALMKDRDPREARVSSSPTRAASKSSHSNRSAGCLPVLSGDAHSATQVASHPPPPEQPRHRDRGRGALRGLLQRRRLHHPRTPTAAPTASCSRR